LHLPVYMHARLAHGETPLITRPNASLTITCSSDCDCTNILLQHHLVVEVQIHAHEVSVLPISQGQQRGRAACLPFVEPHEFRNKGLEMEYDFLRGD
jgi:hypothetical protein